MADTYNEMQSLTLNGKKYDSFRDQTARQQLEELKNNGNGSGQNVELDTTLTQSGKAADAKAVGDKLGELEKKIPENPGGVSDYTELTNKPTINGVEVSGNKTSADYGIGNPTDEQVATTVRAWLDEHPEATTTVADGSITEAKLADGAVTARKSGFLTFDGNTANLFDKATVTDGYSLEYWSVLKEDAACSVSDFIPVEENTVYCRSADTFNSSISINTLYTMFYDVDKGRLSVDNMYHKHTSANTPTFTTPEGCAFVRFNLPTAAKDTAMLVKGESVPAEYVRYGSYYTVGDSVRIYARSIADVEAIFDNIPVGVIGKENMDDETQAKIDALGNVNTNIDNAVRWNDVNQPCQTLTGRINVFENVVKGVLDISSDISDKTVVVHGVNYFDVGDMVATASNILLSDKPIPVQPGKKLYFNRDKNANSSYLIVKYYGASGEFLRDNVVGSKVKCGSFTPDEDVYFIRVHLGNFTDVYAEKLCIADVDIGNTVYGYGGFAAIVSGNTVYFGKTAYFPYVGYRIENGTLIGASNTYTLEELMHVDVLDADSTLEVTAPVEAAFDKELLKNVNLTFGRYADTDYVLARVYKTRIDGGDVRPKVVALAGGKRPSEYTAENDFVLAVTGGIFDTSTNEAYGNLISNGEIIRDHATCPTLTNLGDTIAVDKDGNFVSYPYETELATMLAEGVTGALNGWTTIISDYEKMDIAAITEAMGSTVHESKHPRAAVGQFRGGDYMVFICGGRTANDAGMTGAEMQEIFVNAGVRYAYNLDGGGSCTLRYYKKELAPYTENRAQPAFIIFG